MQIYNVSRHVSLDINSSCWALMLESFGRMLDTIFNKAGRQRVLEGNVVAKAIGQCLETMRSVELFFFLNTCSHAFHRVQIVFWSHLSLY